MSKPRLLCASPFIFIKPDATKFDILSLDDLPPLQPGATRLTAEEEKRQRLVSAINSFLPAGIYTTFNNAPFDRKVFDGMTAEAKQQLRIIANQGVGYNNIDWKEALKCNIFVTNTPDVVTGPTAEIALWLILSTARKASAYEHILRSNVDKNGSALFATCREVLGYGPCELTGKTLAIVGMGNIGKAVAKRAQAFGMKIVYTKRNRLSQEEEKELGIEGYAQDVKELVQRYEVDFLSVHTPLTPDTRHLINKEVFNLLKPNKTVLINTARGPVVDEAALVDALESGQLLSAGLDVFEQEPRINERLLAFDPARVCIVPHIGTEVIETRTKMEQLGYDNIAALLLEKKRRPLTPIPEMKEMLH